MNKQHKQLQKELDRLQPFMSNPIPGVLGDFVGRVSVPNRLNYVYVRIAGQSLTEVFNDAVPLKYDLPVLVGKDSRSSNRMKVLSVRTDSETGTQNTPLSVIHHHSHEWQVAGGGQDVVYSHLRQLLPLRPQPFITGQAVFVYSNISYLGGEWVGVTGSLIDLSGASPTGGSRFVLLYADDDGLIEIATGNIQNSFLLNFSDIPQPLPGTIPIAAVRLYPGQIRINDAPNMRDLVDLRWNAFDTRATVSGSSVSIPDHNDLDGLYGASPYYHLSLAQLNTVISGSSSGGGHIIQDDGSVETQRANLNFVGSNVSIADDAGNDATVVTIDEAIGSITKLATAIDIDATIAADTLLYTVPGGNSFVVDHVVIRTTSMVFGSKANNAQAAFGGNSPDWNNFRGAMEINLGAVNQSWIFGGNEEARPIYQAAEEFKILITAGSDATTEVWAVDVFGYLI